jgi:hypothetical protein
MDAAQQMVDTLVANGEPIFETKVSNASTAGQTDDRINTFLLREILVQLIAIKEAVQRR